ncbi:MAG: cob(I)yrinic acid a,c-diamide adenosyltransferase [Meiothermus sp.]|uniref:cob(I)yrinic acid a,c-diamide adenosyltransferase n=1 Tax=Meiothermus sp. TaxID=1955249 RepID=UPI0025D11ED5|nr:cob(I)yrinic acid a,c-diamide adenosyltransferase [Meiothermus sp.]MCS7058160.1 cob(I)yrinic acid a,c-diamide adenosyltransferase [Meiothermus sp.]MCS7193325.1 cob(I)yrinic acid a,c-diamide adenosyltransferase [Meiothermus sp.]MCX7740878.1 cob(I)yrinic acid a,c-diamide adenosyltransferase [Meiothermus sp.]MDW8091219.1 cob(I)yrinic acid a,c-diamide adenosyltransferase [Meiothermus sp.]MDW8481995.1 cob(I)yrinic acid a,c-diamide adenosyltransferase [Meiothermus sp.]
MKIYTKTGDGGETGLYGAERVGKDHPRVEAYGTVDEANSAIGLARALLPGAHKDIHADLEYLQNALFDLGADLATRTGSPYERNLSRIAGEDVERLEALIDRYQEEAPQFRGFVHPGGHPAAAALHLARTIVRRAERQVVGLMRREEVNPEVLRYLNRLSDLLFTLARVLNRREGFVEEGWLVKGRR